MADMSEIPGTPDEGPSSSTGFDRRALLRKLAAIGFALPVVTTFTAADAFGAPTTRRHDHERDHDDGDRDDDDRDDDDRDRRRTTTPAPTSTVKATSTPPATTPAPTSTPPATTPAPTTSQG